jgi:hypothetical protein
MNRCSAATRAFLEPCLTSAATIYGITARVFGLLNELAIDAVETGAECISDTVIETWKPAIEKEAAFA